MNAFSDGNQVFQAGAMRPTVLEEETVLLVKSAVIMHESDDVQKCADSTNLDIKDGQSDPLEKWIQKNPIYRATEVAYLSAADLKYPATVTEGGELQQAFQIAGWTFLLVLNRDFPKRTERKLLPIRVCLVYPGPNEFKKLYHVNVHKIPDLKQDKDGILYLSCDKAEADFAQYNENMHNKSMSESLVNYTQQWTEKVQQYLAKSKQNVAKQQRDSSRWTESRNDFYTGYYSPAKYFNGRGSQGEELNPRCRKIVLSNRAFIQIFNESKSRIDTETGGLLLGHYEDDVWYVIEASDPGINAVFRVAYHEGDDVYQNHVCDVISRTYKHPLVFLGMWHRHPGSLDTFSGTDDVTNYKYAASAGNGCISAIINYDPRFRITFYYVEQTANHQVQYTKVDVEVGDDKIPNKEMMKLVDMRDVLERMN